MALLAGVLTVNLCYKSKSRRAGYVTDSGDELPSFTDLLSHARPVASRVAPQLINLTIDCFDDVS